MKTVLYFTPHQDDELLSMGIDICESILQNNDTHVILCSDGSMSSVRNRLNNGKSCPIHKDLHYYVLSKKEFIQARDLEFISSCKALGVQNKNIHIFENRAVDGNLSVERAKEIIKYYLSKYGKNIEICTIAPYNKKIQHSDHYNIGQAAKILLKEEKNLKVKFFIEPYCVPNRLKKIFLPFKLKEKKVSLQIEEKIKKAFEEYSYWNPDENRFAIGYHSVTKKFNDYKRNNTIYYF